MKTYQYKLYHSKRNGHLKAQIRLAGEIWNHCIKVHRRYYKLHGKHLNTNKLKVHITKLKRLDKFKHWKYLGSQAIQDIAERIDRAYKKFFDNLKLRAAGKTKQRVGPPGFKKRSKYKSFTLKQAGWSFDGNGRIRINDKVYRYWHSREIVGNIKTITVKRDSLGHLYLFVVTDFEAPTVGRASVNSVAFDFGLKQFLSGHNHHDIEKPLFYKQAQKEIAAASRELSRKKRGSNNRYHAKRKLAKVHRDVANRRKEHHFNLARELCKTYSHIIIEDLNIDGMKRLWGKKISDLGFSEFIKILEHIGTKFGTVVHKIDRWYPSSKTCSNCGVINKALTLKERDWTCECGAHHDRDRNAAINIYRVGTSTLGLGDVRHDCHAVSV